MSLKAAIIDNIYYGDSTLVSIVSKTNNYSNYNEYDLYQNYPNPFNPVTTISYNLSEISKVTLKVYNPLGEEVVILVNETKLPGNYSANFKANNIPSGFYIAKLTVNGYSKNIKMLLLK